MPEKQPQTCYVENELTNLLSSVGIEGLEQLKNVYIHTPEELEALKAKCCIGLLEWMNKVAQENPMRLETDNDDIVAMYLHSLPQTINTNQ